MTATHCTVDELIAKAAADGKPKLDFFEELLDATTFKCYGTHTISAEALVAAGQGSRYVGAYGRQDITLTTNIDLDRGHKRVTLKASLKKPVKVFSHLYPLL